MEWKNINTRPGAEMETFLVLCPANNITDHVVVQVTNYEGRMYPDSLDGNIDYEDAVLNATHWAGIGDIPVTIDMVDIARGTLKQECNLVNRLEVSTPWENHKDIPEKTK